MAEIIKTSLFHDASLIAYWRMEGNSNDSRGSNNGTDTSMTYGLSYGKYNQGANFAGSSFTNVGNNVNLTGSFTIALWVTSDFSYPTTDVHFFLANDNNSGVRQFAAGGYSDGSVYFERSGFVILSSGSPLTSSYNHVAIVYTSSGGHGTIQSFFNGVLNSESTMNDLPATANNLFIGKREFSGSELPWQGKIDEIAIFSRALSVPEILNLASDPGTTTSTSTSTSTSSSTSTTTTSTSSSSSTSTSTSTTTTWQLPFRVDNGFFV